MINRIVNGAVTTGAKRLVGTLGNVAGNGLLISCVVGGSGHAEADFLTHTLQATVRQEKGEDIALISGLRMMDALKISDYKGGFSTALEGDDGLRYVAFLPINRIKLDGDDVLDMQIQCPGDATATYEYMVALVDLVSGPDNPLLYELVTGNGADQLLRDVYALYLVSNPSGATITVKDEAGKTFHLIDHDITDLANTLGEMEAYEQIGTIFSDPYDLSQDIHVKLASGSFAIAVRGFFDPVRLQNRSQAEGMDMSHIFSRIRTNKPAKAQYLSMLGKGA